MSSPAQPPRTLRQVFAQNVRLTRVNAGLSQERMANAAELDRTFIGSLERGERNISIDNIERISGVLGVAPHELMHPDFAELRNLDPTATRAPRKARLYPKAPSPRKTAGS